jgi:hypothetical protein
MADTLKRCPTCGRPHPEDVTTSHHPDGCTCGISLCGGTGPQGCIWSRTIHLDPAIPERERRLAAFLKQAELIAEWEQSKGVVK